MQHPTMNRPLHSETAPVCAVPLLAPRPVDRRASGRKRLRAPIGLALAAAVSLRAMPAYADIYRYEDKDGVIHFSNVSRKGKLVDRHDRAVPDPKAAAARPQPIDRDQ